MIGEFSSAGAVKWNNATPINRSILNNSPAVNNNAGENKVFDPPKEGQDIKLPLKMKDMNSTPPGPSDPKNSAQVANIQSNISQNVTGTEAKDDKKTIAKSPNPKENKYDDLISKAADKYNIDPNLLKAMIKKESEFDPTRVSPAGAKGLVQLMPDTARGLGVKNPSDPAQSINGGAKYISQLLKKYDGNLEKALAAYNAGPGNVAKYGGVPPFKETKTYVTKVTGFYNDYSSMAEQPA